MILDLIRRLKEKGDVSMILVAHNYAHVFDVCDRVSLSAKRRTSPSTNRRGIPRLKN